MPESIYVQKERARIFCEFFFLRFYFVCIHFVIAAATIFVFGAVIVVAVCGGAMPLYLCQTLFLFDNQHHACGYFYYCVRLPFSVFFLLFYLV